MNSNQPQLNMDDLVYNIETKISLLSQIEQNIGLLKNNNTNTIDIENLNKNKQFQQQINLPMQILNKKMMEILNKNNNNNNQRNIAQQDKYDINNYDRTMDKKKRMDLNQLQTGTRNIDEMKRRQTENRSGIKIRHLYHNQHQGLGQQQQMNVKEFKQNNQSELYNMTQSIMSQSINNKSSSSSSSKIINKFNTIQLNYMEKIKSLTFKVSMLQQRLQQSQQQNHDLIGSLETYKSLYTRKQSQIDKQVQQKLQEIKSSLIDRFAEQCRVKYNQYISQLKEITMLLNEQKKRRKFYQQQNKVLKLEKDNYQHMYKSLLRKQKQYLKIDIDRTRNQLIDISGGNNVQVFQQGILLSGNNLNNNNDNNEPQYSQIENKHYPDNSMIFQKQPLVKGSKNSIQQKSSTLSIKKTQKSKSKSRNNSRDKNKSFSDKNKRQSSSLSKDKQTKKRVSIQKDKQSKSKTKRKSKSRLKSNSQQIQMQQGMTKQQLIPFLAKGIQQLKQRLQMK